MEIKFIGTGSGKTSLKRFHSSFIISQNNYHLLIDAGDGISKALLAQSVPYNSINGIAFTHFHPDHFTGLASLIIQMKMENRKAKLDLFMHESLIPVVKNFLSNSYIFSERLNFHLNFIELENGSFINVNENFSFIPEQNSHLDKYFELFTNGDLSFASSSYLFNCRNNKIQYTGDIGKSEDLYLFRNNNPSILITEITHLPFEEILEAFYSIKPEKMILTHISDEDETLIAEMSHSLNNYSSQKIITAFDGLTLSF